MKKYRLQTVSFDNFKPGDIITEGQLTGHHIAGLIGLGYLTEVKDSPIDVEVEFLNDGANGAGIYMVTTSRQFSPETIPAIEDAIKRVLNQHPPARYVPGPSKEKVYCKSDGTCPVTNQFCTDECCTLGAECNVSDNTLESGVTQEQEPQKPAEKGYQILSFMDKESCFIYGNTEYWLDDKKWNDHFGCNEVDAKEHGLLIHSVKRSDGEEFAVNNSLLYLNQVVTIEKFDTSDGFLKVFLKGGGFLELKYCHKFTPSEQGLADGYEILKFGYTGEIAYGYDHIIGAAINADGTYGNVHQLASTFLEDKNFEIQSVIRYRDGATVSLGQKAKFGTESDKGTIIRLKKTKSTGVIEVHGVSDNMGRNLLCFLNEVTLLPSQP